MDASVESSLQACMDKMATKLDVKQIKALPQPMNTLVHNTLVPQWIVLGDPYLATQLANTLRTYTLPTYAVNYFVLPFESQTAVTVIQNSGHNTRIQDTLLRLVGTTGLRAPPASRFHIRHSVRVVHHRARRIMEYLAARRRTKAKTKTLHVPAGHYLLLAEFTWFAIEDPTGLGTPLALYVGSEDRSPTTQRTYRVHQRKAQPTTPTSNKAPVVVNRDLYDFLVKPMDYATMMSMSVVSLDIAQNFLTFHNADLAILETANGEVIDIHNLMNAVGQRVTAHSVEGRDDDDDDDDTQQDTQDTTIEGEERRVVIYNSREWPDNRPGILSVRHMLMHAYIGPRCLAQRHGIRSFSTVEGLYLPFGRRPLLLASRLPERPTEVRFPAGIPILVTMDAAPCEECPDHDAPWRLQVADPPLLTLGAATLASRWADDATEKLQKIPVHTLRQVLLHGVAGQKPLAVHIRTWSYTEGTTQRLHFALVLIICRVNPMVQLEEAVSIAVAILIILLNDNRTMSLAMMEMARTQHTLAREAMVRPFQTPNFREFPTWYNPADTDRWRAATLAIRRPTTHAPRRRSSATNANPKRRQSRATCKRKRSDKPSKPRTPRARKPPSNKLPSTKHFRRMSRIHRPPMP